MVVADKYTTLACHPTLVIMRVTLNGLYKTKGFVEVHARSKNG